LKRELLLKLDTEAKLAIEEATKAQKERRGIGVLFL
jgi:hypothetical protein